MVFMLLVILLAGCEQVQKIQEEQQLQVKELEKQNITKHEEKIEVPKPAKVENKTKEIEEQKNVQQNLSKQNVTKEETIPPEAVVKAFFEAIAYRDFDVVPKYIHPEVKKELEKKCKEERGLDWTADRIIKRNAELIYEEFGNPDVEITNVITYKNVSEVYVRLIFPLNLFTKGHYTLIKENNTWFFITTPKFVGNCLLISKDGSDEYEEAEFAIKNAMENYNEFRPKVRKTDADIYGIYLDAKACEEYFAEAWEHLNNVLSQESYYLGSIDKENLKNMRDWTNKMKWTCKKYKEAYWYLYKNDCISTIALCEKYPSLMPNFESILSEATRYEKEAENIKSKIPEGWSLIS